MTTDEIQLTIIAKAKFKNGAWTISVIDENNYIYTVTFTGNGDEDDLTISNNTYNVLLDIEKFIPKPPIIEKVNETILGTTPTEKRGGG